MRRCAVGQIHQHAVVRARVIYLAIHIVTSADVVQAATDALVIPYKKRASSNAALLAQRKLYG